MVPSRFCVGLWGLEIVSEGEKGDSIQKDKEFSPNLSTQRSNFDASPPFREP